MMNDFTGDSVMALQQALAVAHERIRGLEALVAELKYSRELIVAPAHLTPAAGGTSVAPPGFKIVAGAALATAEADEPVPTPPAQKPDVPQVTWFSEAALAPPQPLELPLEE